MSGFDSTYAVQVRLGESADSEGEFVGLRILIQHFFRNMVEIWFGIFEIAPDGARRVLYGVRIYRGQKRENSYHMFY